MINYRRLSAVIKPDHEDLDLIPRKTQHPLQLGKNATSPSSEMSDPSMLISKSPTRTPAAAAHEYGRT